MLSHPSMPPRPPASSSRCQLSSPTWVPGGVSHRHRLDELKILGRDIERQVLSRAVRWHLEDRVLVDGNKTIVFA